jgi:hypothetical protein
MFTEQREIELGPIQGDLRQTVWAEFRAAAPEGSDEWASSDRGWLFRLCEEYNASKWISGEYNDTNTPIFDENLGAWRERSSVGNYLTYSHGPDYSAEGPKVHAVCYCATPRRRWFNTISEAKAWIEEEGNRNRR